MPNYGDQLVSGNDVQYWMDDAHLPDGFKETWYPANVLADMGVPVPGQAAGTGGQGSQAGQAGGFSYPRPTGWVGTWPPMLAKKDDNGNPVPGTVVDEERVVKWLDAHDIGWDEEGQAWVSTAKEKTTERVVDNADGTKSVWVGDKEQHRYGTPTEPLGEPRQTTLPDGTVVTTDSSGKNPHYTSPKPPPSLEEEALRALVGGDDPKAQALWKFKNQLTPYQQIQAAQDYQRFQLDIAQLDLDQQQEARAQFDQTLRYASSPADYLTVWGMLRGELPAQQQQGSFGRIAPDSRIFQPLMAGGQQQGSLPDYSQGGGQWQLNPEQQAIANANSQAWTDQINAGDFTGLGPPGTTMSASGGVLNRPEGNVAMGVRQPYADLEGGSGFIGNIPGTSDVSLSAEGQLSQQDGGVGLTNPQVANPKKSLSLAPTASALTPITDQPIYAANPLSSAYSGQQYGGLQSPRLPGFGDGIQQSQQGYPGYVMGTAGKNLLNRNAETPRLSFAALGGLPNRSAQTISMQTPSERAGYLGLVAQQGIDPRDFEELERKQTEVGVGRQQLSRYRGRRY